MGLAGGLWARPELALVLPVLAAAALWLGRHGLAGRAWPLIAAGLATAAAALPVLPPRLTLPDTLLLLTLDQGVWLFLGFHGLVRRGDPAARALTAAGAILLAAHASSAPVDALTGHALYRLGLLLGAAPVVADLCERAGRWMSSRVRTLDPSSAGAAALVALLVPGSFLAWWDPTKTDRGGLGQRARAGPRALRGDRLDPGRDTAVRGRAGQRGLCARGGRPVRPPCAARADAVAAGGRMAAHPRAGGGARGTRSPEARRALRRHLRPDRARRSSPSTA